MKTKTQTHTPGPWTTEGHMGEYWHIGNKNESPILTILCKREEAPVNARLIAAAPELLGVLKGIMALPGINENHPWAMGARAAIKRAEGGK